MKNKKFKKTFTVTIEGTSTNEFIPETLETGLKQICETLSSYYKQATITVEEKGQKCECEE